VATAQVTINLTNGNNVTLNGEIPEEDAARIAAAAADVLAKTSQPTGA